MENEETVVTPEKRRMAIIRALPLLFFTLCAISVIGIMAFVRIRQVGTTSAVFDATVGVCRGVGFANATAYPSTQPIHSIIAFTERDGFIQGASNFVKPEWQPEAVNEIELVLCTSGSRPAFRSLCSNQNIINPIGSEIEAKLREAQTGAIVSEGVITSDPLANADCLDTMPSPLPEQIPISDERVHEWLTPFVEVN
ncbi:MAG: hypothetical protein AAF633_19925 [Chloroflexota bacterium]